MSDNMFAGCETAEAVVWAWAAWPRRFEERLPDAIARIAELTPRTVDEAGRERARAIVSGWLFARGMSTTGIGTLLDEIIDALGWTAEPEPEPEHGVGCGCLPCLTRAGIKLTEPAPAPATPAVERVDMDGGALQTLTSIVRYFSDGTWTLQPDQFDVTISGVTATLYRDEHGNTRVRIGGGDE